MNRKLKYNTELVFFFLSFFLLSPQAFADKSYQITKIDIDAQLHPDGSMDVTESRTYRFEGSFRYAYRELPTTGPVSFQDLQVSEDGQPYRLSDSEVPGTYKVAKKSGQIKVTWFYRANNESRTFEFHYRAQNAIRRYEDAAVLYFKFISEDWDRRQKNVRVLLKPPIPFSKEQINQWLHGPLWAESEIEQNGTIIAWCEHIPKHTFLEVRALYPPQVFHLMETKSGLVREQIMAEETQWAHQANRQREMAIRKQAAKQRRWAAGKWIVSIVSLAGLLAWWSLYKKYGKRPKLPTRMQITSDIPEKTPPALVGYLLNNQQIYGGAMVSTLLDLAQRGFIALREEQREKKGFLGGFRKKSEYFWDLKRDYWNEHSSELFEYENELLQFIFDDLADGEDSIAINTIKKKQSKFTKFFRGWQKGVKKLGKEKDWFDKESTRGMFYSFGVSGVMLLLTVVSAFLFGPWAIILGVVLFIVFVLSFLIPHRTREGEMQAQQWKAVKRYLQKYHYRAADRTSLLSLINDYFVYGVVLGLSSKVYKELATYIPPEQHGTFVPWYAYHGAQTGAFSPETFGAAFSSMVATTTSAMSMASGTGGGASGGGGGGASSGGGGAG